MNIVQSKANLKISLMIICVCSFFIMSVIPYSFYKIAMSIESLLKKIDCETFSKISNIFLFFFQSLNMLIYLIFNRLFSKIFKNYIMIFLRIY
jgi:hypothetical protein